MANFRRKAPEQLSLFWRFVVVFFCGAAAEVYRSHPLGAAVARSLNRRATAAPRGWLVVILLVNLSWFCLLFSGKGSIYPAVLTTTMLDGGPSRGVMEIA